MKGFTFVNKKIEITWALAGELIVYLFSFATRFMHCKSTGAVYGYLNIKSTCPVDEFDIL